MINKRLISKVLIIGTSILLLTFMTNARINCNGAGGGYDDNGETLAVENSSIETLIIEGSGYYLDANSNIQIILRVIEWQDLGDIDFQGLRLAAENASNNIDMAKKIYETLIRAAESTPYNQIVISKLMNFNYDLFMQEHGLNPVLWKETEEYLKNGNITGVFKRVYSSFCSIAAMVKVIKSEISQQRLPTLTLCWQLNEKLADISLFGSYVARVFTGIR